jgi:hypothetical protein
VVMAARSEVPAGAPCEDHCDHPPLGTVCDSCHRAPSVPMTKTCMPPSASAATAGDPANPATAGLPCENHCDEPSLGPVCRRCHRDASSPTTNSSNRPSRPEATAGRSRRNFIPDGASCGLQPDQPPLGAVCLICHSLPSLPTTKSSRCASALETTTGVESEPNNTPEGLRAKPSQTRHRWQPSSRCATAPLPGSR